MKKLSILLLIIFSFQFHLQSAEGKITLHKDSKLSIHGSTNLVNFTLDQKGYDILNKSLNYKLSREQNKFYSTLKHLNLSVGKFKSNNPIAESEFYKMMEVEKYPILTIELVNFERKKWSLGKTDGIATVNITIKGVRKTYEIAVNTAIKSNKISLNGQKELSIKDFGIEPPVAMLGLVKVSEWIKINFELICDLTT